MFLVNILYQIYIYLILDVIFLQTYRSFSFFSLNFKLQGYLRFCQDSKFFLNFFTIHYKLKSISIKGLNVYQNDRKQTKQTISANFSFNLFA